MNAWWKSSEFEKRAKGPISESEGTTKLTEETYMATGSRDLTLKNSACKMGMNTKQSLWSLVGALSCI